MVSCRGRGRADLDILNFILYWNELFEMCIIFLFFEYFDAKTNNIRGKYTLYEKVIFNFIFTPKTKCSAVW